VLGLVKLSGGDLVSMGEDGTLQRWKGAISVRSSTAKFSGCSFVKLIALHDDGFLTLCTDSQSRFLLKRWAPDLRLLESIPLELDAFGKDPQELFVAPIGRGSEFVTAGKDGRVRFWNEGRTVATQVASTSGPVRALLPLKNGDLVSAGEDGTLRRWRLGPSSWQTIRSIAEESTLAEFTNGDIAIIAPNGEVQICRDGKLYQDNVSFREIKSSDRSLQRWAARTIVPAFAQWRHCKACSDRRGVDQSPSVLHGIVAKQQAAESNSATRSISRLLSIAIQYSIRVKESRTDRQLANCFQEIHAF